MLTCSLDIKWPDWQVYAWAAALQVPALVICHAAGALVFAAMKRGSRAPLIPLALSLAVFPLWAFPEAARRMGSSAAADAQLGFFCAATNFAFAVFRTLEVWWGTQPAAASLSLASWQLYFNAAIDPRYDTAKALVPAPGALSRHLTRLPPRMLVIGALCSITDGHDAGSPLSKLLASVAIGDFWRMTLSNLVYSVGLWLFLALTFDLGGVPILAQGVDVTAAFANPVFGSRSPREFWGKRWNRQVNALLRRVCFSPLKARIGGAAAALATFACSAAFHEYQFALSLPGYALGRASVFFACMGGLTFAQALLEKFLSRYLPGARTAYSLCPTIIQVAVNMTLIGPFGHLFVEIWRDHGMLDTIARMVPTVPCAFT